MKTLWRVLSGSVLVGAGVLGIIQSVRFRGPYVPVEFTVSLVSLIFGIEQILKMPWDERCPK